MFPEKLQPDAVDFDGTPGMGFHQIGKILFPLFQGQFIGATIEMLSDSAHGARVRLNGLLTFALKFERRRCADKAHQIESFQPGPWYTAHCCDGARNWATLGVIH
jgi:hypothetical protein